MPTKKRVWVAPFEFIFGLLALVALATENIGSIVQGIYDPLDLWSRFTYQSNLIAMIALLASSYYYWRGKESRFVDWLRGAATLYLIVTGVVFATLVHNASPVVWWDNNILHQVIPTAMVISWLCHQPSRRVQYRHAILWLCYPLAYAAYVQVYARLRGVYLYEFLDPSKNGWAMVIGTIVGLFAAAYAVMRAMILLPRQSAAPA